MYQDAGREALGRLASQVVRRKMVTHQDPEEEKEAQRNFTDASGSATS